LGSQDGGPNMRYVINSINRIVFNVICMLIVLCAPPAVGNLLEGFHWITGQASGKD